jgi:hypothetical protein
MKCVALSALCGSAFAGSSTLTFEASTGKSLSLNFDGTCEGTLSACTLAIKSDVTQEINTAITNALAPINTAITGALERLDSLEGNHTALKNSVALNSAKNGITTAHTDAIAANTAAILTNTENITTAAASTQEAAESAAAALLAAEQAAATLLEQETAAAAATAATVAAAAAALAAQSEIVWTPAMSWGCDSAEITNGGSEMLKAPAYDSLGQPCWKLSDTEINSLMGSGGQMRFNFARDDFTANPNVVQTNPSATTTAPGAKTLFVKFVNKDGSPRPFKSTLSETTDETGAMWRWSESEPWIGP